ncbi:MAG: hypothetical protein ACO1N9_14295 [Flavobacterium sp.]
MAKEYKPLLITLLAALVFYILNKALFFIPEFSEYYETYHYSLETLFLFFTGCSLLIVFLLTRIHKLMPDNIGYAFLAATTVKMGFCFLMLRPILSAVEDAKFEKGNFFALFILFLATETIVTIRLLNKKQ